MNTLSYFLGGSSPTGFCTRFGDMIFDTQYYSYIIKGGPGTGKSSLMKRIAEAFPDEEKEFYYCSSDPDSLDAVIFKRRKVILADGTAPHCFDPEYPGAVQQILNLGIYWDDSALKKFKDEIISATFEYRQYHARCRRFITALSSVALDTFQIGKLALNKQKLEDFISRFTKKILPKKHSDKEGKYEFRQLSAITPNGYLTNIPQYYDVYLLNDSFYSGSETFIRRFAEIAVNCGYDVSISACTLWNSEFFEHLLIPELKLAFLSSNPLNALDIVPKQSINFKRFYDKSAVCERKTRLKFNKGAVKNLRDEAVQCLENAKSEHDKLEHFYISAMDFDSVNRICYSLISEIKSL